nr:hypothetical protein [Tanacetum cinerariifolium]
KFIYGPKQTSADESDSKPVEYASSDSDYSVEPSTSVPEPVAHESKVEYESDSDDDLVSNIQQNIEKSSFAFIDSVKHVKTPREKFKETGTPNHYLKIKKHDRYSHTRKGNKAHLADYQEFKGGYVAFGGSNGRITGKGKIKDGRLDFEDVYYVEELKHYNLFYVSQMCDKKNKVLFTDTDCLVLSSNFKLPDEKQALIDESNKWHRRLGHVNFKNLNKLGNLVRGLPSEIFENDHTCVACLNGKETQGLLSDNGTEFKNHDLIEFCGLKGIKREYSNAKTPQQNIVVERKNRTLIEAARTMLADSNLPTTFWAEAVNTACYVLNREELEKLKRQEKEANDAGKKEATHETQDVNTNHTNLLNAVSAPVSAVGPSRDLNDDEPSYPDDPSMPHLEEIYVSPSAGILLIHPMMMKVWNKKDERIVVFRNKARLVAQGHRQEEGIDYNEVFVHVARIESIRIFLAFASYMGFIVYQMDVKSAFLYCIIDKEVYMIQPLGFVDPKFPNKTASTSIETQKPLVKNEEAADMDVHLYRKSTTRGCQFLGRRLISWQCKKQTIMDTSTIEAKYVAAAHCCG